MSVYLLDTDHLTLYQLGHPQVLQNVAKHLSDILAISVITIEEQLSGWQRALNQAKDDTRRQQVYSRMALTVESLANWRVISFSIPAMAQYAALVRQRLNVGSNDLKIAATALEINAKVVTLQPRVRTASRRLDEVGTFSIRGQDRSKGDILAIRSSPHQSSLPQFAGFAMPWAHAARSPGTTSRNGRH